jgi:Leucine-rich repeat (LRR) protein
MKSETNVSKGCLTFRIALLLSSVLVTDCSKSLSLIASQSRPSRPLLSGQTQTQFVYQALPLYDRQSLPSLGPTLPVAEALSTATNGTNGCSPLEKYPICWCYDSDQGLLIDCGIEEITEMSHVLNTLSQPIKSLSFHSINDSFDSLDSLPDHLFHNLSTLAALEQISLSLPSLAQLSLEAFLGLESSLKSLSLINTNLRAVPKPALSRLKSLTTLDLQSNAIEEVESYAFQGLPLVTLNLQSNLIDTLHEMSFAGLEHSLVELVLIDNRLHSFPFVALTRLSSLEILRLQSNRISQLEHDNTTPLSILPMLKTLDLHSNRISLLDGQTLFFTPNLVSLSVANNSLTALNDSILESLPHLESLDLSYNQLEAVTLNDLVSLKTVDLSNNRLEDIRFDNLFKLKEVFASHNRIARLTDQTFINSSSLSAIFLQSNAIESIDYNAFHSLPNLITLDLSSNKLKTIDPRLLAHSTQLQSLYLDHNMLNDSGLESNTLPKLVRFIFIITILSYSCTFNTRDG